MCENKELKTLDVMNAEFADASKNLYKSIFDTPSPTVGYKDEVRTAAVKATSDAGYDLKPAKEDSDASKTFLLPYNVWNKIKKDGKTFCEINKEDYSNKWNTYNVKSKELSDAFQEAAENIVISTATDEQKSIIENVCSEFEQISK